eukprot:654305-Alexandrium_andersonii.AAC.1
MGCRVSPTKPNVYIHDELQVVLVLHVDDFLAAGSGENILKMFEMMQECGVLLKTGEYLEERGKALSFLNREKWIEDGAVVSLASPTLI